MPAPLSDEQAGFSGGYNPNAARVGVAANQFSAMVDVRVLSSGEIAKAPGMKSLATADNRAYLFPYAPIGSSGGLAVTNSGTVYSVLFASLPNAVMSLTSRATGSTPHFTAAHFRDGSAECLYLACGSGKLSKYQGTTFSSRTIGLTLNLLVVWVYNQRLFGITGVDQTLYWSALNNGDTIGDSSLGGGSATIRTYGGQALVNGFTLGSTNMLQHSSALSKFVGLTFDDIAIQSGTSGVTNQVGSLGWGSSCVVDGVAYCVDRLGFYTLTEAGAQRYNSPATPDPVRALIDWMALNVSTGFRAIVAHNARANEIWVAVLGTREMIFIYSLGLQRFTGQMGGVGGNGFDLTSMASITDTDGSPQLLVGDINGKIAGCDFRFVSDNTFTRINGQAYASSFTCRRLFTDRPLAEKGWDVAAVQAGSGAILGVFSNAGPVTQPVGTALDCHVSYTTPVGGTVSQTGVGLASDRVTRVPISGTGEWIDVTISDDGSTTTEWSIASVGVQGSDMGLIGR